VNLHIIPYVKNVSSIIVGENVMKSKRLIQLATASAFVFMPSALSIPVQAKVSEEEANLVRDIARDGMLEVRLGKTAEERVSTEQVKDFGKHMVLDHSSANEELREAAQKDGVELPSHITVEQKQKEESLKTLNGEAFDSKYMTEMVSAHKKAVEALTKESTTGTGNLKSWAEKILPTIKEHSKEAKSIDSKVAQSGLGN